MKLYTSKTYINAKGIPVSNLFLILNNEERYLLKEIYDLLLPAIKERRESKTIKWNKLDTQAMKFMKDMLHYHHEGEMLDPTYTQVTKFIDKTLAKIIGRGHTLCTVMDIQLNKLSHIDDSESYANMERKRKIKKLWLQYLEGLEKKKLNDEVVVR